MTSAQGDSVGDTAGIRDSERAPIDMGDSAGPLATAPTTAAELASAWLEVTVRAAEGAALELASAALFEAGASGVEELPPDASRRPGLRAYLPPERIPLDAHPLAVAGAIVTGSRRVGDRDWTSAWRAGLCAIPLGERLCVCPHGEAPLEGRIAIDLDPGGAFGTGLHPTTRLAAGLLERALGRLAPPIATIDVGTGSGILAIAAHKLGARPVLAIDNDPQSVIEAGENARRNGCRDAFEASDRPIDTIEAHFDLVVANLEGPIFARIGDAVAARVRPGGLLVASGLRATESFRAPATLTRIERREDGGWAAELWSAEQHAPPPACASPAP